MTQVTYTPVTSSDDDEETYCVHSLPSSSSNSGSESDLDTDGDRKTMPASVKRANKDRGKAVKSFTSGACSCGKTPTMSQFHVKTSVDAAEGPSAVQRQTDTSGSSNTDHTRAQPSPEPSAMDPKPAAAEEDSGWCAGVTLLIGSIMLWGLILCLATDTGGSGDFHSIMLTVAVMTPMVLGVVLVGLGIKADANARYERVLDSEIEHAGDRPVRMNDRGKVWGCTEGDLGSAFVVFVAMLLVVAAAAMLATGLSSESHQSVQEGMKQNVTKLGTHPYPHHGDTNLTSMHNRAAIGR